MTTLQIAVILPAAGASRRYQSTGGAGDKLSQLLEGRPVLLRAVDLFAGRTDVAQIIIAAPPDRLDEYRLRFGDALDMHDVTLIPGGTKERWETVSLALQHVREGCTHIAVHDAARPLASSQLIARVFDAASRYPAVIPGLPVAETLKRVGEPVEDAGGMSQADLILGTETTAVGELLPVEQTVDRRELYAVQTPQVFEKQLS